MHFPANHPAQAVAHPTRRTLLRRGLTGTAATAAALTARWAKAAEDAKDSGAFKFIVVNDVHYFDDRCGKWLDRVLTGMNAQGAEFCLIVGDLTEDGTPQQTAGVRAALKALKVPLYCVVGNHDHQPGDQSRQPFEQAFPNSINYFFEHRGFQFVGLDTTQGRAGDKTAIAKSTLEWTAQAAKALDPKRPTVLFTHFPLGWFTPSRPANANALLEQFTHHNLRAVFNGHFHGATERLWGEATITTNTCCSFRRNNHDPFDKRKGYFLCTAQDGAVKRSYVQV